MEKFSIDIETYYKPDTGNQNNVFNLSSAEKRQRDIGKDGMSRQEQARLSIRVLDVHNEETRACAYAAEVLINAVDSSPELCTRSDADESALSSLILLCNAFLARSPVWIDRLPLCHFFLQS